MNRRDMVRGAAIGLPLVGVGLSAPSRALAATPGYTPIYVAADYGTSASDVAAALQAGATSGRGLIFESGLTFQTDNIVLDATVNAIPPFLLGYGATLIATSGVSGGALIDIRDPQDKWQGFQLAGFVLDGNTLVNTVLRIEGSQRAKYCDLTCQNSLSTGIEITGSSGYGVYYNEFANIVVSNNGSTGWAINSIDNSTTNYVASNSFLNCSSMYNGGYGWSINYANNTYVGCEAEKNSAAGFNLEHTLSSVFLGGYTENNGNGTSFQLTPGQSTGVVILGGRHIGQITGSSAGSGNVFLTSAVSVPLGYDINGTLSIDSLGIASTVSYAGTTTGPTSRAMPVYDANGNALGYVPVYASLW